KFTELLLGSEERIKTLHFEIHLDMICQTFLQLNNRNIQIFFGIQCGSNSSKQVGILRSNRMFVIQLQCPDKCRSQLGEEMQRTAEECNMSADRLSACQTADCLIDYRLENRGCQVLLCGTVIDQRLDICLGKHTAACGNIIKGIIIFCIFIQTCGIRLKKRGHLVDKGTGTSGTDSVHSLFHISILKIDNLCVLAAKLDGDIGLRSIIL